MATYHFYGRLKSIKTNGECTFFFENTYWKNEENYGVAESVEDASSCTLIKFCSKFKVCLSNMKEDSKLFQILLSSGGRRLLVEYESNTKKNAGEGEQQEQTTGSQIKRIKEVTVFYD